MSCINRKRNFLLYKDHETLKKENGRKTSISVKRYVLIIHFIRVYLVPLPPYGKFKTPQFPSEII